MSEELMKRTIITRKIDAGLFAAIEKETLENAYGRTRRAARRILLFQLTHEQHGRK